MSTPPEQNGIYIRPQQMWDKLCAVEATLNDIRSTVKTTVKDHGTLLGDHEKRIRAIEQGETEKQKRDSTRLDAVDRRVAVFSGAATVLGAGAGYLLQFLAQ